MHEVSMLIIPPNVRKKIKVEGSCWLWVGYCDRGGYAIFRRNQKRCKGHRWIYEHLFGKIEKDLVIDHLCRNRNCINPIHLEPVTNKINILRGNGVCANHARNTHCPSGHPYYGDNLLTYAKFPGRFCRTCKRLSSRKAYYKRKERALLELSA